MRNQMTTMMKIMLGASFALAFALSLAPRAAIAGGPNAKMTVQGVLREDSGVLQSGSFDMTFTLYDAATGGTVLHEETIQGVLSDGGVFTAVLGTVTPLDPAILGSAPEIFLGVSIDGGNELSPRTEISSFPRALTALNAETFGGMAPSEFQVAITGECSPGLIMIGIVADGTVSCAPELGDITSVIAGVGLMGGATSSAATLDVNTAAIQTRAPGT